MMSIRGISTNSKASVPCAVPNWPDLAIPPTLTIARIVAGAMPDQTHPELTRTEVRRRYVSASLTPSVQQTYAAAATPPELHYQCKRRRPTTHSPMRASSGPHAITFAATPGRRQPIRAVGTATWHRLHTPIHVCRGAAPADLDI